MEESIKIAIAGERQHNIFHQSVELALLESASALGIQVKFIWLNGSLLQDFRSAHPEILNGVWIVSGPHPNREALLDLVDYATEENVPLMAVSDGMQALLGHLLQLQDEDPLFDGWALLDTHHSIKLHVLPGTRPAAFYRKQQVYVQSRMNYLWEDDLLHLIDDKQLQIAAMDEEGRPSLLEHREMEFLMAATFEPQLNSSQGHPSFLVTAFLKAAIRNFLKKQSAVVK